MPLALTAGAAIYMNEASEPGWPILAAATLPPAMVWAALHRRGKRGLALLFGLLACAGIGAIAAKVRTAHVVAPVLREEIGPVRIEGIVAEIDSSERSRRIRIAVHAIEGLGREQTPDFVRFSYRGDMPFGPGRAVACRAILSPPPRPVVPGDYTFHRSAFFEKLGAVGFSTGRCNPLPAPPPSTVAQRIGYWIDAVRRSISQHVYAAAGKKGGGIAAAVVSGDRSYITAEDSEALRLSGLAHLLAISGLHMVLVGGVSFFAIRMLWPVAEPLALRVPAIKAAALGAIVACTLYFLISGMAVSTQRAYIMALIGFSAKLLDRPALSLRSLAVALGAVVLLQPESVVTPGFQMSFAASGSLIALYEAWPRLDRPSRTGVLARILPWLAGTAATSLVASMATMPFALHHFDRAAPLSVIANIASSPLITFITTPSAAAAAIAAPLGLDGPFLAVMGLSLEWVLAIANWSAEMSPDMDTPRLGAGALAWSVSAIAIFCLASGRGRIFALVPLAISLAVWLTAPRAVGYIADDGSVFLKAEAGWLKLTDWRGESGLNPLVVGDDIRKPPCPGKGAACRLDLPSGRFEIVANGQTATGTCPTTAVLTFMIQPDAQATPVFPCSFTGRGGAAIELGSGGARIRPASSQNNRPWTPLLYERPARRPQ